MLLSWKSPFLLGAALWRMLRAKLCREPVIVTESVHDARVGACSGCPHCYKPSPDSLDWQCRKCTCFVEIKAWADTERCPEKRWRLDGTRRAV